MSSYQSPTNVHLHTVPIVTAEQESLKERLQVVSLVIPHRRVSTRPSQVDDDRVKLLTLDEVADLVLYAAYTRAAKGGEVDVAAWMRATACSRISSCGLGGLLCAAMQASNVRGRHRYHFRASLSFWHPSGPVNQRKRELWRRSSPETDLIRASKRDVSMFQHHSS
jgi:hypothetical protein